jgi:hypothetical protein
MPAQDVMGVLLLANILFGLVILVLARGLLSRVLAGLSAERTLMGLAVILFGGYVACLCTTVARGQMQAAALQTIAFLVLCLPLATAFG